MFWVSSVLVLLILLFLSIILIKKSQTKTVKPSTLQESDLATPTPTFSKSVSGVYIYQSYDNQYFFSVIFPSRGDKCQFFIQRTGNTGVAYTDLFIETDGEIPCMYGNDYSSSFESTFLGWASDNSFLLQKNRNTISIYKIVGYKVEFVEDMVFDGNHLEFRGADSSLNYWLFKKKQSRSKDYVLLDSEGNIVLELKDKSYGVVLYDPINNGFLFPVSDVLPEQNTGTSEYTYYKKVTFDFLDIDNLTLRTVYAPNPKQTAGGEGCSPSRILTSTPGSITISASCYPEFKNEEGNLIISI
jgi:hypothetical protein